MDFKPLKVVFDLSRYCLPPKRERALGVEAGGSWRQEKAARGASQFLAKEKGSDRQVKAAVHASVALLQQ